MLPTLRFLQCLRVPNSIALLLDGKQMAPPQPTPDFDCVSDEYVELVDQIARIQSETGTHFAVPNNIDVEDVASIRRLVRLLDGKAVAIQPEPRYVTLEGPPPAEWTLDSGRPSNIAYQAGCQWTLMGQEIDLGRCTVFSWPVIVETTPAEDGKLRLHIQPLDEAQSYLRRGVDLTQRIGADGTGSPPDSA